MLTEQFKATVANGVREYLQLHKEAGMSQNRIAKQCGINSPGYVGYIIDNKWNAVPAQGGAATGKISDPVFLKLYHGLGLSSEFFETDNYLAVYATCMEAKVEHQWRIIDGPKGAGKSFSAGRFARLQPRETFLIRCKNTMNAKEFIQAIASAVGASEVGTRHRLCMAIVEKLIAMSNPLLIIDETEALFKRTSEGGFGAIKDICDEVNGRVGIVMIGANSFLEQLQHRAANLRSCFPQLLSRFATAPVELELVRREDVALIAPAFGVMGKKEQDALFDTSADFRDLFGTLRRQQSDANLATTLKAAA
jgi:DNA transposition AAA+ family ATPase